MGLIVFALKEFLSPSNHPCLNLGKDCQYIQGVPAIIFSDHSLAY